MNQKQKANYLALGILLFIALSIFFFIRGYLMVNGYEFNGIVQKVTYSVKGTPYVIVNGKEYVLDWNSWGFDNKIQQGDSLIKEKNTLFIKLVKQKTGEVIFFNKP